MNEDGLKKLAHRQIAHFEALRKLGISPDDIFVAFYNGGELFTTLRQRGKEFNITISRGEKIDAQAYKPIYEAEAAAWNTTMTDAERDKIYYSEYTEEKFVHLAVVLQAKGFEISPNRRGVQPRSLYRQ